MTSTPWITRLLIDQVNAAVLSLSPPASREENNMGKQAFYPENELIVHFYLIYLIIFVILFNVNVILFYI